MVKVFVRTVLLALAVFTAGWLIGSFYITAGEASKVVETAIPSLLAGPKDVPSPHDWVKEEQIHVYNDRVVIDLPNAVWASFTDTNSMDPVFDAGSNGIELVPESAGDIHMGDVISYKSRYIDGTVIHRVVETGLDKDGWYCIVKGDNNQMPDPEKVRFSQIKRVLVGIIY